MTESLTTIVGYNGRIEFAEGIARQHGFSAGDALRLRMTEAATPYGRTITVPDGPFVVDLNHNSATRFSLRSDLMAMHDIEEDSRITLEIQSLISDEGEKAIGESTGVPAVAGEPTTSQVSGDRVRFADGLTRLYDISAGDSLRVTLTDVLDRWGDDKHTGLTESFVVDTRHNNATQFVLPKWVTDIYDIESEEFVRFRLHQLITDDSARPIGIQRRESRSHDTKRMSQRRSTPKPPAFTGGTREPLEEVVACAFETLGYDVTTNAQCDATDGGSREVDIWATHPNAAFATYVSCKNTERRIGRPIIDEEVGRIDALCQRPHVVVIVGPEFADGVKQELESRGVIGIETGQQVGAANKEAIYRTIHDQLATSTVALGAPDLQGLAQRAASLSEELTSLAEGGPERRSKRHG